MIVLACEFEGPPHEYPDDWLFDGPRNRHPGADPRYRATTYVYFDDKIRPIHLTQTPLCDDQAIDEFTFVRDIGPGFRPVYLQATRPNKEVMMLKVEYNSATDIALDK